MYTFLFLSGKDRSTICNGTEQSLGIIIGGGVGGGIACLVFVTVIFISFLVSLWACCKLIIKRKEQETQGKLNDKQREREHEDRQRQREHNEKMKKLELEKRVRDEPVEVVREYIKQICDKTNPKDIRIAMIKALPEFTRALTPISATDMPALPITPQAEASPQPESSTINIESDVAVEIEMERIKSDDGGDARAGPPPPPPTYEQSMNHPMVIIKEEESPEVLEALQAFIGGFSGAVEEYNQARSNL